MPQFGVRLSDDLPDIDQVARATGLSTNAVKLELASGYVARGLSRGTAERMVADLATAGLAAEVSADASSEPARPNGLGRGLLGQPAGLSALGSRGLGERGLGERGLGSHIPGTGKRLPGLGLGLARTLSATIHGQPAPVEFENDRVGALAPPIDLPPPIALPASVTIPPVSLPPPTSDAELMPSLKVPDPAALPPPKVFNLPASAPMHTGPPPRVQPVSRPAARRTSPPSSAPIAAPRALASSPPPAAPRRATGSVPVVASPPQRVSIPPQRMALDDGAAVAQPPARATRIPWVIAATLIIVSGVLVAWAWSGRDAAVNAMRQAEVAYAQGNYSQAGLAAERARTHGADVWADRMMAAVAAGPHLDQAEAQRNADDLKGAQTAVEAALALAPKDARTLQAAISLMKQSRALEPSVRAAAVAPASLAPASVAPASVAPASVAPASVAPARVTPVTAAPPRVAPASAAPATVAPARAAPASAAPSTDAPPVVRFARPPSAPTRNRSTVARLKIVGDLVGEIVVDGTRASVAVPGWIEVPPGRRKIAVRGVDGKVHGLRTVTVKAGRRATVRLSAQ